jgi:hypothetical protein
MQVHALNCLFTLALVPLLVASMADVWKVLANALMAGQASTVKYHPKASCTSFSLACYMLLQRLVCWLPCMYAYGNLLKATDSQPVPNDFLKTT